MESSDTATGVFSLSQSDLSANLGTEGNVSLVSFSFGHILSSSYIQRDYKWV